MLFISNDTFHFVILLSYFFCYTFYVSLFDNKTSIRALLNVFFRFRLSFISICRKKKNTHTSFSPDSMEIFSLHFVQNFSPKIKILVMEESVFSLSTWLPLVPVWVLCHSEGHKLGFDSPYKIQAYNLVLWYPMVIRAIKYHNC